MRCHARITVLDSGGALTEIVAGTVPGYSVTYRQGKHMVSVHVCRDCSTAIIAEGLSRARR